MKQMAAWRGPVLVGLAMLMVGGCSRTSFGHAPLDTGTCDPALAGRWQDLEAPVELEATVGTDCQLRLRYSQPRATHDVHIGPVQSGRIGAADFLWFSAAATHSALDLARHPRDAAADVYVLRYQVRGDTLTLWQPDHARVAQRIITGKVNGDVDFVTQQSPNELVNHVRGDAAAVRDLIARGHDPFAGEPGSGELFPDTVEPVQLRRVAPAP